MTESSPLQNAAGAPKAAPDTAPPPDAAPQPSAAKAPSRPAARHTAVALAITAAGMLGLSFAAVPLYTMFCRATGFAGTPLFATAAPSRTLAQRVTVRLDANVAPSLPWSFVPEQRSVTLKLGETVTVDFHAENQSDQPTQGIAAFNIEPELAAQYFNKLSCFCSNETPMGPHEARELPVVFFVDPALAADKDVGSLTDITLSYTFFASKTDKKPVAPKPVAEVPRPTPVN